MGKRLGLLAVFLGLLTMVLGGCIVRHRGPRHGHRHYRSRPVKHRGHHKIKRRSCARSHYWDGRRCRHRGRGHGARKHDY
jgi:hypothetical protein